MCMFWEGKEEEEWGSSPWQGRGGRGGRRRDEETTPFRWSKWCSEGCRWRGCTSARAERAGAGAGRRGGHRGAGEVVVGREGRSPATRGARRGRRLVGAAARGGGAAGGCRASVGAVVVRARGFENFGNEEAGAGRAHM